VTGDHHWAGVFALADPSRRELYEHVRRAGHAVSREEAADAAGISRNLAAFHLDKLVDAGLLRARYEAPADRPRGRGRSPKVYEPTGDTVTVTIPQRRYQLIAEILADAIVDDPAHAQRAAREHAHRWGQTLGAELRTRTHLPGALDELGFEPERAAGRVLLRNCPFHALAQRHTALVCGLNHAFVDGLVEGLEAGGVQTSLAPYPDRCCVELSGPGV
jgi:predicted ArsR family transcriptional regulator